MRFLLITILLQIFLIQELFAEDYERVLKNVQALYERYSGLEADFVQVSKIKSLRREEIQKGKLYIKKPGKMKWDYREPEKKVFLLDGERIWNYIPEEKQVLVYSDLKGAFTETAMNFLTGTGSLLEDFSIDSKGSKEDKGIVIIKLIPKEEEMNLSFLLLLVDKDSYIVKGLRTVDIIGNETIIDFKRIELKQKLDEKLFRLDLPEDIEIIEMGER